jgi:putative spermidine/putrescine transport system ATP-binding protein
VTGLSIEGLRKTYGDAVALDGVSIALAQGEFVALLGPSGCGKTTTLRSVAGFVEPDAGEIRLGEAPLTGLPPFRRNIGIVFQSYALFPHMTAAGNVGFGLKMRNVSRAEADERVARALDLVGLGRLAGRYPAELSGGQQQRVALARALVIEPAVLLLDEPLSNLDAGLRAEMRDEIAALTARLGVTTLFVTHDQAEALAMSHRVAVMDQGRIVEVADPETLAETPQAAFTARFLGGRTVLEGAVSARDGQPVFVAPGGLEIPVPQRDASRAATHCVLRAGRLRLTPSGPPPDGAARIPVTVENAVFLGEARQITVRAGAARIMVHAPAEHAAPRKGEALHLEIPEAAVRLLADTDHA